MLRSYFFWEIEAHEFSWNKIENVSKFLFAFDTQSTTNFCFNTTPSRGLST